MQCGSFGTSVDKMDGNSRSGEFQGGISKVASPFVMSQRVQALCKHTFSLRCNV